jgi:hypothetical protein
LIFLDSSQEAVMPAALKVVIGTRGRFTNSGIQMRICNRLLLTILAAIPSGSALACASCGCSLNSDWSVQGLSAAGGWSADLRYDYLNQNQLRSGTGKTSPTAAAVATNTQTNSPAEVEQYTKNNYLTATLDYNNGNTWGLSLVLPYIDRSHSTLGSGSDGSTFDPANGAYGSSASGLGDVRVLGRYFGFSEQKNFGVQFGLKLPTGGKNQVSSSGSPQPVDPGLQLGTGTTDLIVGAYRFDNLSADWDYFTQASLQTALNSSTMAAGSYKPGSSMNLNFGVRYQGIEAFIPTLQINARYVKTDSGDAADTFSTGGKLVYLTPGVIVPLTEKISGYANVQLPIYQNVNGIQLAPKYIVSVGARIAF